MKTDQVDSDVLALLLRADLIPEAHMIRPAQRGPRDLMRARLRLVEKRVSAQNSVDRLLVSVRGDGSRSTAASR